MFVNVIVGKKSSIYQCNRAHMTPKGEDAVFLDLEDNGSGGITLDLLKADSEVYFMNDNGRTIDSYRWAVLDSDTVAIPADSESEAALLSRAFIQGDSRTA